MIGKQVAHYRIEAKLGQGGMGEVHRAEDTDLSRQVATRVLPSDMARDPERLARFRREAARTGISAARGCGRVNRGGDRELAG